MSLGDVSLWRCCVYACRYNVMCFGVADGAARMYLPRYRRLRVVSNPTEEWQGNFYRTLRSRMFQHSTLLVVFLKIKLC